jgi:membrane protein YdbS with pleckstrin-like domain
VETLQTDFTVFLCTFESLQVETTVTPMMMATCTGVLIRKRTVIPVSSCQEFIVGFRYLATGLINEIHY